MLMVAHMEEYCRQLYRMPAYWTVDLKISFDPGRRRSWGGLRADGRPYMSLALYSLLHPVSGFHEYARMAKDPEIGNVLTTDWRIYLTALISHEISHSVQFSLPKIDNHPLHLSGEDFRGLGTFKRGHGDFFRAIYLPLRRRFTNRLVPPEAIGKPIPTADIRTLNGPTETRPAQSHQRTLKGLNHPSLPRSGRFAHPQHGQCRIIGYEPGHARPVVFKSSSGIVLRTTEKNIGWYTRLVPAA